MAEGWVAVCSEIRTRQEEAEAAGHPQHVKGSSSRQGSRLVHTGHPTGPCLTRVGVNRRGCEAHQRPASLLDLRHARQAQQRIGGGKAAQLQVLRQQCHTRCTRSRPAQSIHLEAAAGPPTTLLNGTPAVVHARCAPVAGR